MPKFEKKKTKQNSSRDIKEIDQILAFKSLFFTLFLGIISFILSVLFNVVDILSILALNKDILVNILNIGIKVITTIAFFFFMLTSIGNYKDLLGKPANWADIMFLFCLSLFQTVRDGIAFGFTFLCLIVFILYFYLIQEV